jgi:Na+-transporting methylmalonyl-CoA/oxaloacetate decarboxylase gamma subunit
MAFLFGYAGGPDGYAPEEITFWWIAIGMGFVVLVVVILLLSSLVAMVKSIDRSVSGVRDTLRAIPENTANAALIPITADRVDAVLAEGLQHHLFLTRVLTGSGTPVGKG